MKLALIGAGQRGMIYSKYAYEEKGIEIAAVVETDVKRRNAAAEMFSLKKEAVFTSTKDFFEKGKIADALIIATMDRDHYEQTMQALETGYDILLEKPISPDPAECLKIQEKAKEKGCLVIVCHVLRYTNFFSTIKKIIDSGELGKIVTIQHNENIGNFHMAHSFVRGNWRRSDQSSPIIMQKSCHDMDILCWLTDSGAKKMSSFGSLTEFKQENAPEGSADRCINCKYKDTCQYSAITAYLPIRGGWPATVLTLDQSEEGIMEALKTGDYGRCVYHCDNDVCDHQVTIIEFENGVTADFSLSGFTNKMFRTINIMCEKGEIRGNDETNTIEVTKFATNMMQEFDTEIIHPGITGGFHGGGDVGLMEDFLKILQSKSHSGKESKSAIEKSVESHVMAYAAEKARIENSVIDIDVLKKEILK